MAHKHEGTNARKSKNNKKYFPQSIVGQVELMWENLKEGDVEEGSTSDPLENTIAKVLGKAGWKISNSYAYTNTDRAGYAEHNVRHQEVSVGHVSLRDVKPKAECHDSLVHHHRGEDRHQLPRSVLETNGDTLKN